MALTILHAGTAAAVAAAMSQQDQCEALVSAWAGSNVRARLYAGAVLLRTLTVGPWTINTGSSPRKVVGAAGIADAAVAAGVQTRIVFERLDGTPIFECTAGATSSGADVNFAAGQIRTLCRPTLAIEFLANPALPALPPAPAWVQALPLWEWYPIPGTALSSVTPSPVPLGNMGPRGKVDAWNGACLKRSGSVYMLGAAGGHRDYGGNEVDALALNTASPGWVQLCPPTPNNLITSDGIDGVPFYVDEKPSTTHTYHSTQFIDSLNRMMVFNSPGYNGPGGYWPPDINTYPWKNDPAKLRSFSFNVATGQWDHPDYVAYYPFDGDFTSQLCVKHPWTSDVILGKQYATGPTGGIWRFNAASNSWTKLTGGPRAAWHCGAAIDPIRSRMLIVGGAGATPCEVRDLQCEPLSVTFGGLGKSVLDAFEHYDTCVYDEALDAYLALTRVKVSGAAVSTRLLMVTADTFVVSEPTTTGTPPLPRENGLHNSFQYVPELRGVVIMDSFTGNVKFMRTAAL